MVLDRSIRWLYDVATRILGAIVDTLSGVALLLALPTLLALVAFTVPGFVGSLGVDALVGGSFEQVVMDVQQQTVLSPMVLGALFFLEAAIYVVGRRAGHVLYETKWPPWKRSRRAGASGGGEAGETDGVPAGATTPEDYRGKFARLSFVLGGFVGVGALAFGAWSVVVLLAGRDLWGFGGGLFLALVIGVFAAFYLGIGYTARQDWIEGLLIGILHYVATGIVGLGTLNPLGILVGGYGTYYGVRGLRGSQSWLLEVGLERLRPRLPDQFDVVIDGMQGRAPGRDDLESMPEADGGQPVRDRNRDAAEGDHREGVADPE